jgi:parvulin-like peptidyl-prolyl isomerase
MKRSLSVVALSLIASFALGAQAIDKQVATVRLTTMQAVTLRQLRQQVDPLEMQQGRALTKDERRKLLDGLVNRILIEQAAARDKVVVSDAEFNAKLAETKATFAKQQGLARDLTDQELQTLVRNNGINWDEFTKQLRYGLLVLDYVKVKRKATLDAVKPPTDQEALDYYESNKKNFFVNDYVRIRHIYLDTRNLTTKEERDKAARRADDILRELKGGVPFDEVAAKYSEDGPTKYKGGEVGWLARDDAQRQQVLGKAFFDAVFHMKVGEVSGVLASNMGLHIVQCEEVIPAHLVAFTDKVPPLNDITVKDYVKNYLLAAKQQDAAYSALDDIVQELRKQAEIKVFEENLAW